MKKSYSSPAMVHLVGAETGDAAILPAFTLAIGLLWAWVIPAKEPV